MLSTDYKYYRTPYGTVGRPDSQTCPVRPQGIPGVDTLGPRGVRRKGSSRRDIFGNSDRPRGYSFPSRGTRTTSQRLRTAVVPLRTTPPALPAGGYSSHSLRTTFSPRGGIVPVPSGRRGAHIRAERCPAKGKHSSLLMRGAGATCTASPGLLWNTGQCPGITEP